MQVRHATITLGSTAEEVVILEGSKAEAIKLLEAANFSAPVLLRLGFLPTQPVEPSHPRSSRTGVTSQLPSIVDVLDILRNHPERYRQSLEDFVRAHPDLGPAAFFREFFGVTVSAHGESRLAFNALYVRMRTIRARLGLGRKIGNLRRHRVVKGESGTNSTSSGPADGGNVVPNVPKPSEIRIFMEELVLANRTVSTKDLQNHFYGPGFSPSTNPADHVRNKRLVDYAAVARKSLARRWHGQWRLAGPAAGPNVVWRFVRPERQETLESNRS